MGRVLRTLGWGGAVVAWVAATGMGFARLWRYEGASAPVSATPQTWPSESSLQRDARIATLVMLLHPKCPCSRATIDELSRLMAHCQGTLVAKVLIVKPDGAP